VEGTAGLHEPIRGLYFGITQEVKA